MIDSLKTVTYSDRDETQAVNCLHIHTGMTDRLETVFYSESDESQAGNCLHIYVDRDDRQTGNCILSTQTVMRARLGTVYIFRQR
jgi:hypothetical protein